MQVKITGMSRNAVFDNVGLRGTYATPPAATRHILVRVEEISEIHTLQRNGVREVRA